MRGFPHMIRSLLALTAAVLLTAGCVESLELWIAPGSTKDRLVFRFDEDPAGGTTFYPRSVRVFSCDAVATAAASGRAESYRDCRRAHSERGWSPWDDRASIPRSCVSARSGLVLEHAPEHPSQWAAIRSVAEKTGLHGRSVAALGAPGGARRRPASWPDDRRAPAVEAARTRKLRAETRE